MPSEEATANRSPFGEYATDETAPFPQRASSVIRGAFCAVMTAGSKGMGVPASASGGMGAGTCGVFWAEMVEAGSTVGRVVGPAVAGAGLCVAVVIGGGPNRGVITALVLSKA